jgi:hypothetical protein
LGAFLEAWGSTIRQKAACHCEAPCCMGRDMSLFYTRTKHGLFEQSIIHVRCGQCCKSGKVVMQHIRELLCVWFWPSLVTHFDTTVSDCRTGSNKSGWDHVTGQSASPTLLLLHRPLSARSVFVFHQVSVGDFIFYGYRLSFGHLLYFMFPRIV